MQSTSIIRRWIRGSLLITVLVLVLAEGLFLYYSYNAPQDIGAAFCGGCGVPRRARGLQAAHDGGKTIFHRALDTAVEVVVAVVQERSSPPCNPPALSAAGYAAAC